MIFVYDLVALVVEEMSGYINLSQLCVSWLHRQVLRQRIIEELEIINVLACQSLDIPWTDLAHVLLDQFHRQIAHHQPGQGVNVNCVQKGVYLVVQIFLFRNIVVSELQITLK